MQDLNDLFYFTQVIEQGGFAAASRALGVPKSRLSRRVADLEERLGVRLLQRTTRRVALTEVGHEYLQHCQAVVAGAEAAQQVIERVHAEPCGTVRVCSPVSIAQNVLGAILPGFLLRYPAVKVHVDVTNRPVDLIDEGYDIALRVRQVISDSSLVIRRFGKSTILLLAAPSLLARYGEPRTLADLAAFPTVAMPARDGRYVWNFVDPEGLPQTMVHEPRLVADDLGVLLQAVVAGVGLATLPLGICRAELAHRRLELVLSDHAIPHAQLHAVYPSRRGLVPAVRCLLDTLSEYLESDADERSMWPAQSV